AIANETGLEIGLINMARLFDLARQVIQHWENTHVTKEIFVAEGDEVARALNKNPDASLTRSLLMKNPCSRRIDFYFGSPRPSLFVNPHSTEDQVVHEEKRPQL
ncbi:MAG: hypothetical protein SFW66_10350, partial [Gammaproteobacteria bacterium]|nr:hypothetical protein [Gammaproteobacteria bacterium]